VSIFDDAFAAHGAGHLDEAERGYRAVLAADSNHADAWHLLGMIDYQRGRLSSATTAIRRAVALNSQALYLTNLGIILDAQGKREEAIAALEQSLVLDPQACAANLALGNALRSSGRLEAAAARYRQALATQPDNASAHNNLGNVLQDLGQLGDAEACYLRTISLQPQHGRAHYNLGLIWREQGRIDESAESFRRALLVMPDFAEAHFNLGVLLKDEGHLERAVQCSRDAYSRSPADAGLRKYLAMSLYELGMHRKRQGRIEPAVVCLTAALEYKPDDVALRNNLANALIEADRAEEAEAHLRHGIALAPAVAELQFNLGNALKAQSRFDEAIGAYDAAIRLKGGIYTNARVNLAGVLVKLDRYDEALQCYEQGLTSDPSSPQLMSGKGFALQLLGRLEEGLVWFDRARERDPELAEAHRNAGLALLMKGDFAAGWPAYEWRWRVPGAEGNWRNFPYPVWQGEAGPGTILISGEQGLGDKVLYSGMIPDLCAQGLDVIMETDARLVSLFERSFPGVKAVPKENPPHPATLSPDIRWHTGLANIGRWLRPRADSFPARPSYLVPDAARQTAYRARLTQDSPRLVVGISWMSSSPKLGRHKSLDLKQWAPILQVPGVRFVDLQYGDTAQERESVASDIGVSIAHMDDLDMYQDIDGVTALAAACDLVVSVSSTHVHLAASAGRPTWVLVPASAGSLWYWMRDTERTPWYPSVTIFRQTHLGQWDDMIAEIADRLRALVQVRPT